ncbi:MAG: long-chain-fatty-acid--CoA ligase [Candidatus Hydrogenedens sp.]|nr:long-chain-fatty-acid--CoA ligase [Candidatus Hydrogenedens sp.]
MNIPEYVEKTVGQAPDNPMIFFEKEEVTYGQMFERSCLVAGNLKALGIQPGDKIALMLGNSLEYLYCFLGFGRIGALMVPINPALSFEEYIYIIENSEARFLVLMPELLPVLPRLLEVLPQLEKVFVAGPDTEHSTSFSSLLEPCEIPENTATSDSDAALIYTSGTTGKPKGVILTHGNYIWDALALYRSNRISSEDRFLCVLPLFHVNAQVVSILTPMLCNARIFLVAGMFNPFTILPMIEQYKITTMSAVPTIYGLLTRLPKAESADVSSIRFFVSGAAPMPEAIYREVQRVFKKPLIMGYGLSEATCASSVADHEDPIRWNSVGPALRYTSIRIVDKAGKDLPVGEIGEVLIAGPTVMKGYYRNPEATAEVLQDGWLKTGDLGHFDSEGYLYIVDRVKDMIIRGGLNVYTAQVEQIIARMDAVEEVAVIGVDEATWGQEVLAVVKIKEEHSLTEKEVIAFCRENLAAFKCPRYVRFIDELPKTAIGKVRKHELHTRFAKIAMGKDKS